MKWVKISIETTPENIEPLVGALILIGLEAVEIDDPADNLRFLNEDESQNWDYIGEELPTSGNPVVRFYLSSEENRWTLDDIEKATGGLGTVTREIVEDDWSDAWLEFYKPFRIGKRVIVRPHWEEYTPQTDDVVFTIDPGHVFGTGQHQSTSLCIQLLEKHITPGVSVLDIGCGSGILGIIARLLGAGDVVLTDIDPAAPKVVSENARLNGIDDLTVLCGNILKDQTAIKGHFDLVLANIVADVIIPLSPIASGILKSGGIMIVGGIINERANEVVKALNDAGLNVIEKMAQDDWVSFCVQKVN